MATVYMTGNTHFDPVWLWRWDEAMASIRATFRSVLDRMEEDGDFKYAFSAPAVFEWILATDPELFREIQKRIEEGRWELGEGWWLQADAYTGLGESYVRQGLYGQRWLHRHFGKISRTLYAIDSFGHPDTLPALLSGVGIQNIMFCRPEERMMELPQPLFQWEGRDGTRLLAYRCGGEDSSAYAPDFKKAFDTLLSGIDRYDCDRLVVFGVTDHGGAPTKECLREIHRLADTDTRATVKFSSVEDFFNDQRKKDLPVVKKELSVTYIGPSSNESEVKKNDRRAERLVLAAETAALIANRLAGRPIPKDRLEETWRDVLFNQFHDIIGGCCIPTAYVDARDLHGRAAQNASEILNNTLQSLVRRIRMPGKNPDNAWNLVVFNLTGVAGEYEIESSAQWAWEFPWHRGGIRLRAEDGTEIPAQTLRSDAVIPGFRTRFTFRAELPAWGWRTFVILPTEGEEINPERPEADATCLESDRLRLTVGKAGGIARAVDKATGRTLAEDVLVPFTVGDICDTWGFNKTVMEEDETPLTLKNATVTEDGCERKTVKLTLATGTSTVEQYITLWKKTDRVDSRLRVIWSEKRRNLRLSLRYAGADVCTAAVPAGFTDRAESEYERPMNGWIALWGKEGGIRLASDDLFAYRYQNGDVHLTVLRNVVYGDLRTEDLYPDGDYDYLGQGLFDATVKCRFFEGAFDAEEAETSAIRDLSAPKTVLEANHGGDLPADFAAATLSGHGLIPMALKCEEDGEGAVLRVRSVAEGAEGVFRFLDRECTVTARTFAPATYLIDKDGTHRTNLLEDAIEV